MSGRDLVAAMTAGRRPARPPFVPVLGRMAATMTQTSWEEFTLEPQGHAMAVLEAATAMNADAVTVGVGTTGDVAAEAVRRLAPLLAGRAVAGVLAIADPAAVRALCDAGADLIILLRPGRGDPAAFRTAANICGFYQRSLLLLDPDLEDAVGEARRLGLGGAIVAAPSGSEPGIVGGGLSGARLGQGGPPTAPRPDRFFWSFAGEVPEDAEPEALAALGEALTG